MPFEVANNIITFTKPLGSGAGGSSKSSATQVVPEEALLPLLPPLKAFGYTREALEVIMLPMAATANEPLGSMGNDAALAAVSTRAKQPYEYFKQLFAQVTNPAIDPFREAVVTSLRTFVGPAKDVTSSGASHAARLDLKEPCLSMEQMEAIKHMQFRGWATKVIDITYPVADGPEGLKAALDRIATEAEAAVDQVSLT